MHILLVILEAKPGKEQALKEALTALIEPTRQEEGCLCYVLHESPDNPAQFMFYENWANKEAHAKHLQTSHFVAWRAKKDELLAKLNDVTSWKII